MGVFTYESQVITAISPAKMFKACVLDGDNLIPKILPQAFKSIEYIEGNGEPGGIKKVTFGEGSQFKYMKQKTKLEASPDGGSLCKTCSKYYTVGEFELKEEGIKAGKGKSLRMFKAIEAYLLANPDAYKDSIIHFNEYHVRYWPFFSSSF
ncbi:major allergen Pru av 1-like [Gossypium arboreum]|uniref:major allergen Pru av 1-like n=1 Tax=Gossypium arboreum TaxID=29729 RepID=UPI0022F19482|nr:major allergen Pru av 1-like [Gossypium arboreum]